MDDNKHIGQVDSEGRFWRIPTWFPELGETIQNQLRAYHAELIYFNGRMNLISPRTEKAADQIHFADGILGGRLVFSKTPAKTIFDLGSGNGIPGIVMAVLDPSRKIVLVDADARKIEFLKHCIGRLGLSNCIAMHARLEELEAGLIKCAVSRGFASISKALLMARQGASSGCEFFHFKGPAWSSEVAEIPSQVLANWEPSHAGDYDLPLNGGTYTIILTKRK